MKGTLCHTCILAPLGLAVCFGCIPDLPAERVSDAAGPAFDSGLAPAADAAVEAAVARGCGDGYIDLEAGEQCDPNAVGAPSAVCSATCRVLCPSGFVWMRNNHCYLVAGTSTDLTPDAVSACDTLSGHVVTFASEAEFEAVEQGLALSTADPIYWVGLTTSAGRSYVSVVTNYEPGWDPTCPGCYAHAVNPKVALPRYIDPVDGGLSSQSCVGASPDQHDPNWRQRPCSSSSLKTRVICEREPIGAQFTPCEAGICVDLVATYGAKRYVIVTQAATADVAEQSCASLGGRLVVLQSRDEREQLWLQISRSPPQLYRIWIGLSQKDGGSVDDAGDSWVWDDGTEADSPDGYPSPWGDHLPATLGTTSRAYMRAYMGEIDDTLARNDEEAQIVQTLPFVCELPIAPAP